MKFVEVLKLIGCMAICELTGLVGSLAMMRTLPTWYASLHKPSFSPPDWIFGPVWTILYLIMGIALYLVLRKGFFEPGVKTAIIVFAVQLILNAVWSFLFFGSESPLLGLIDIVLLWTAIAVTIVFFSYVSKPAALLLFPYIFWVSFAVVLNFFLWRLNP
jgi:translocator protein